MISAALAQKLAAIYEQHKHKTGSCRTPDDFALSLQVYEQYIQFMEAYRLTCQPVLNHILEQTAEAEAKLQQAAREISAEEAAKQAAQDPNHTDPIDVEAKEVPTERTMLKVQLDENDPNPHATVEALAAEHKAA